MSTSEDLPLPAGAYPSSPVTHPVCAVMAFDGSPSELRKAIDRMLVAGVDAVYAVMVGATPGIAALVGSWDIPGVHVRASRLHSVAAATNEAIRSLPDVGLETYHTLLMQPGVVVNSGSLTHLVRGLDEAQVAAVGPVVVDAENPHRVVSAGGLSSRWWRAPRLLGARDDSIHYQSGLIAPEWVPDAATLYRAGVLAQYPLFEHGRRHATLDYQLMLADLGFESRVDCSVHVSIHH